MGLGGDLCRIVAPALAVAPSVCGDGHPFRDKAHGAVWGFGGDTGTGHPVLRDCAIGVAAELPLPNRHPLAYGFQEASTVTG